MHVGFINIARYLKRIVSIKGKCVTNKLFSDKYLIVTNVSISITLSAVGDILEQNYEIMRKDISCWDPIRTRNMAISGCTVGILCHYWYILLDRELPGRCIKTVAKKVLVDQVMCSPITLSVFFFTLAVLEGSSIEEFVEEVKKKAWRLYVAECILWPPLQFLNFYMLPTKYRVLYDNAISLVYDVYTSYVKHDKH